MSEEFEMAAEARLPGFPVDRANTTGREPLGDPEEIPELSEVDCPDQLRETIETLMDRYPDKDSSEGYKSAAIPALWAVQRTYGWCTPQGIRQAAAVMRVTPAYLESVASFYDLLRQSPAGNHQVLVCTNISCWMRGADGLLDAFCREAGADRDLAGHGGAVSADGEILVSGFECMGSCDLAPMASIDERYFGPLDEGDAETVIEQLRRGEDPVPAKALSERDLPGGDRESDDERVTSDKGPNR
ncbi:MAG: NAD(P)H-dependent oxidoreductase subunit E [Solirubrobacterales bacterium]|nr:NAD(P)H-dependent oxidoreductase subunit E [Solirubrobacterales bacterium]